MEKNRRVEWIKRIWFGVWLIILLSIVLYLLCVDRSGQNGMSVGPFGVYTVLTGSMNPTFDAGSVIITKEVTSGHLKAGDIIAFRPSGDNTLVTHRIMEVIQDGSSYSYITKGDANNVNDMFPVTHQHTVGRVVFWVGGLGKALLFIRSPQGIAWVVAIVFFLIFLSMINDTLRRRDEKHVQHV